MIHEKFWARIYSEAVNGDGRYAMKIEGGTWYRFRRMVPFGDQRFAAKFVEVRDVHRYDSDGFAVASSDLRRIAVPVSAIRQMEEVR